MYWDALLLLPMLIVTGMYYYELFTEKDQIDLFSSCASSEEPLLLRYNKRLDASRRSDSTTLPVHKEADREQTLRQDMVPRKRHFKSNQAETKD